MRRLAHSPQDQDILHHSLVLVLLTLLSGERSQSGYMIAAHPYPAQYGRLCVEADDVSPVDGLQAITDALKDGDILPQLLACVSLPEVVEAPHKVLQSSGKHFQ